MKTNIKTGRLKQENAETAISKKAEECDILLEDEAKPQAVRIQLKRKSYDYKAFTPYEVWMLEGMKEENERIEEYAVIYCIPEDLSTAVTPLSNFFRQEQLGTSFRYRNMIFEKKEKDGKSYFVVRS